MLAECVASIRGTYLFETSAMFSLINMERLRFRLRVGWEAGHSGKRGGGGIGLNHKDDVEREEGSSPWD